MKKFIKHIALFFIPLLFGTGSLFFISTNKSFTYNYVKGECDNMASWIYNRIFIDKRDIDIVFSGASHTSCAIMDNFIETELNKHSNKKLNVANLGYCRGGRDIQYVMLKDLFENKKPRIIIVGVSEDELKKSHPVFPYLASTTDLFNSFVLFNQRYVSNIWKGIIVRFEYLRHLLLNTNIDTSQKFSLFGYRNSQQKVEHNIVLQNMAVWEKRLANPKQPYIRKIELNYSKHYLEKIINLAEKNNCKVLFLYLPESGSKLQEPLLLDYYKCLAEVVLLPKSIINDELNWKDATHFNDSGAIKTSQFIVEKLLDEKIKQ